MDHNNHGLVCTPQAIARVHMSACLEKRPRSESGRSWMLGRQTLFRSNFMLLYQSAVKICTKVAPVTYQACWTLLICQKFVTLHCMLEQTMPPSTMSMMTNSFWTLYNVQLWNISGASLAHCVDVQGRPCECNPNVPHLCMERI